MQIYVGVIGVSVGRIRARYGDVFDFHIDAQKFSEIIGYGPEFVPHFRQEMLIWTPQSGVQLIIEFDSVRETVSF